ncbi:MAG: glycosyltransferase family 2 protein [Erysipelotrichaceae bacterium]
MLNKKILLIVPAFNEEKNIGEVYNRIKQFDIDIIIINDGSTDQTKTICEQQKIPHINSISNLGIGGAVQMGYKYASLNNYDIAVQFDGDGQHNILDLEELIKPIVLNKADFVIGSRFIKSDQEGFKSTAARRLGIRIITKLIHLRTKQKVSDPTSGYRAANKKIIDIFANFYPTEYPEPESLTYLLLEGYRINETPVTMNERINGKSSIHSWKNAYYMLNVCLSILLVKTFKREGK